MMETYRNCLEMAKKARGDHLEVVYWLHEALISRVWLLKEPAVAQAMDRLITQP